MGTASCTRVVVNSEQHWFKLVAIALIMHKIPDGFVLSSVLTASRNNGSFFYTMAFLAVMTPLGTE